MQGHAPKQCGFSRSPMLDGSGLGSVAAATAVHEGLVCDYFGVEATLLDAHVACASIPQAFCGLQHAHHFNIPVYGWLMKMANGIGVKKDESGQFNGVKEQIRDRAARSISVLVFPEGRRTQNGRILPFKRGVFAMARDAELPVCALAVRGLWGTLRRNEWVLRPEELTAYVGPQIQTKGLTDAQLDELARRMQRFTSDLWSAASSATPRPSTRAGHRRSGLAGHQPGNTASSAFQNRSKSCVNARCATWLAARR